MVSNEQFAAEWERSATLFEVAAFTGMTPEQAQIRGNYLRKFGMCKKRMRNLELHVDPRREAARLMSEYNARILRDAA